MAECRVRLSTLVFILPILAHLTSGFLIVCPLVNDTVTLKQDQKAYFYSEIDPVMMILQFKSESCNVIKMYELNILDQLGRNSTMVDFAGRQWYQMGFTVSDSILRVTVVGNRTLNYTEEWNPTPSCDTEKGIQFGFSSGMTLLAMDCSDIFQDDTDDDLFTYTNSEPDQTTYYRSNYSGGHIIFIPVGAIIFLISVCCRCCYRRERVLQPVRTIAVVGGVPAGEVSSPRDFDLPPSYSDVQEQVAPPPAYSEIEKQYCPSAQMSYFDDLTSETTTVDYTQGGIDIDSFTLDSSLANSTPAHHNSTPAHHNSTPAHHNSTPAHHNSTPAHHNSTPTHHNSTLARVLTSRPKGQFSFKSLEEEE